MTSRLYLVATPIGNLEDLSPRAVRTLGEAALIAAEDTRTARKLLAHLGLHTPVTSYFEHNEIAKLETLLAALETGDVALISEAGMPGLSDPGTVLVRAALERGVTVVPIPGPSAVITALVASGLPTDQFMYVGFLPRDGKARREFVRSLAGEWRTLVAYEAPHRVLETLADLQETLGNREICAARELTKLHEEFLRGPISEVRAKLEASGPRGEFTLVIAGAPRQEEKAEPWSDEEIRARLQVLLAQGLPRTEAARRVAREAGRDRREVYAIGLGQD